MFMGESTKFWYFKVSNGLKNNENMSYYIKTVLAPFLVKP